MEPLLVLVLVLTMGQMVIHGQAEGDAKGALVELGGSGWEAPKGTGRERGGKETVLF